MKCRNSSLLFFLRLTVIFPKIECNLYMALLNLIKPVLDLRAEFVKAVYVFRNKIPHCLLKSFKAVCVFYNSASVFLNDPFSALRMVFKFLNLLDVKSGIP